MQPTWIILFQSMLQRLEEIEKEEKHLLQKTLQHIDQEKIKRMKKHLSFV